MKLLIIKTKDKIYISSNLKYKESYYSAYPDTTATQYLYDGIKAKSTFHNGWFELPSVPLKIEKLTPGKNINYRWELKAGFPESKLTPKLIKEDISDEDNDYWEVRGLYTRKFDTLPETLEPIDIEWEILAELPNFTLESPSLKSSTYLIDQITTPTILLSTKPCFIGGRELYDIIRSYVKQNIDGKYARITSDYNFSFDVQKSIRFAEPISYRIDQGTKRKSNYVTKYETHKQVSIFRMGDGTSNYPPFPATILGNNQDDLKEKVNIFLKELINVINEPLIECSCCKGTGAIKE